MNRNILNKLKTFFSSYTMVHASRGTILLAPNEDSKHVFFLERGIVRSYDINKNGEESTLLIFKSPSFFPSIPLFLNKPNTYYFQTLNTSMLYKAPKADTLEFLNKNPDVVFDLTSRIIKGLEGVFFQIELMHNGSAYQKLVNMIHVSAQRFGSTSGKTITIPFTHQLMGSIIGSKRETVSRQLKKLKDRKIIEIQPSKIRIINPELLKKELASFS